METLKSIIRRVSVPRTGIKRSSFSLSRYLPSGTVYFYGYPAGEDSGFLNKVPPSIEELVAARVFSCAGEHTSAVGFAATTTPALDKQIIEKFGIPQADNNKLIMMPPKIDVSITGDRRNQLIKQSLKEKVKKKTLIMAYPFDGADMKDLYRIDPEITWRLNDKSLMNSYMNQKWFPKRYGVFSNGEEFHARVNSVPVPCVIKAAASSSGDGVYICQNGDDLAAALTALRHLDSTILAEQLIDVKKNYVVNFGVPFNEKQAIDIIGVHEQLTGEDGTFLGGKIESADIPAELNEAVAYLRDEVLPKVREIGWYGVGGFDVLVDHSGKCYFIDCNFRINSTSAFHFLNINGVISAPLVSFSASFKGSQEQFEATLGPVSSVGSTDRFLQIIALARHDDVWNMNVALMYKDQIELKNRAYQLLASGLESAALNAILK